jgi:hypothetical protein
MTRLYHPDTGAEIDAASPEQEAIYTDSGWLPAPDPVVREGYATEPVHYVQDDDGKYAPEEVEKPAKATRATKKSADS